MTIASTIVLQKDETDQRKIVFAINQLANRLNSNTAFDPSGIATLSLSAPQGRLSLVTATPVMTSTTSGATTVYYTPCIGQLCPVYDGSQFNMTDLGGELSQATTDSTKSPAACAASKNYDVFIWSDSGTLRATRGPAWSSDTTRGTGAGTTELQMLKGIQTNKNAITNGPGANLGTYVGTIRTNGSSTVDWQLGTIASTGGPAILSVWNCYNRVFVSTLVGDSTLSWTLSSNSVRAANASNNMRVTYISGLAEDAYSASYGVESGGSTNGSAGVGYNSTSAFSGGYAYSQGTNNSISLRGNEFVTTSLGLNFFQALEGNNSTTANTFYGQDTSFRTQNALIFSGMM